MRVFCTHFVSSLGNQDTNKSTEYTLLHTSTVDEKTPVLDAKTLYLLLD